MLKPLFTSDTHFGHANIIRYSARPFIRPNDLKVDGSWISNVNAKERAKEMDEVLIANWNAKVSPEHEIYHLGDFSFGWVVNIIPVLRRLNFKKLYFLWGNHDKGMRDLKTVIHFYPDLVGRVVFLGGLAEISVNGQDIVLCHYAMRVWNRSHHGAWHLYGHSHGSLADDPNSLSFDVGVDCHELKPLTFDEVASIISKKTWKAIDHHGERQEGGGVGLDKDAYAQLERKRQYDLLKKEFGN